MEEKKDYQDAYEKEHYKAVYLANRVAELEDQVDDLQFKLNRIKNNPIWKASGPARKCMHFVIRQKDRLKNCGSLSGVIAKVRYKSWEKKAMTHYGTRSFPSAEERQKQEAAVFERMPKISILVPLWNTPESFLTEMIGSVQWQTYKNWELCLADGSDDAHAYVAKGWRRRIRESFIRSLPKTRAFRATRTNAISLHPVSLSGCLTTTIFCIPAHFTSM